MLRNYSICGKLLSLSAPFFPADSENWKKFLVESAKSDITVECRVTENLPEINGEWSKRGECDYCTAENMLYKRIYMGSADGAVIKATTDDLSQKEITFAEGSFKTLMDERYMWSTIGLAESLLYFDSLLMHASFIEVDGEAILFTAPSGTGKSTQAELWRRFGGATVINGDKAGLCCIDNKVYACGVPFCGTSGICENKKLPLKAIVELGQSPQNIVKKLTAVRGLQAILGNTYIDMQTPGVPVKCVELINRILSAVNVYHLDCTPDERAVEALKSALENE
ncbi:MAG: hypothetical protein IJ300_10180 [Clostridia bacterium]|nr:hypothetical protein [Clostridia bacterium]MBQ8766778.1 hypothetical protein [Clostridia bacterium]